MQPRSQIVATAAFKQINSRKNKSIEENKKYATLVHKLPAMILQNGLAQATGFLLAKSEDHHKALLEDLTLVFKQVDAKFANIADDKGEALHNEIIQSDLHQIMRMTREALEIAGWLRRYVQGVLKIDATGEVNDEHHHHPAEAKL
ncbi:MULTISPECIES: type III-B CRISPR module-associated protein Cmr5 [Shewanella]|uniref:type III-B CRISPR module-associated protein Cmr5 n=1 Tax=Shewanella TaxID=22 RepID=UPI0021DA2AED|nr:MULTISPECIES: type III-B CRISPR module-associated protein Cmr5 [unclassified Shewanella]MCU8024533.1 type III-B CRISPR module-associated protein Cmr5 [Shewanella sp. SM78]MCU8079114.1 type III-B CRISPR module-associated protein Cmr5 [Shewanella sp. SM103]